MNLREKYIIANKTKEKTIYYYTGFESREGYVGVFAVSLGDKDIKIFNSRVAAAEILNKLKKYNKSENQSFYIETVKETPTGLLLS